MRSLKHNFTKVSLLMAFLLFGGADAVAQNFQGKAYYLSKSTIEFGSWGATLSEERKKEIKQRLKNRLEKNYILTFNIEESTFDEEERLDAVSGATDSWGKNFTPGTSYKNIKTNRVLQDQEFYGKKFLIADQLLKLEWNITDESKKIGDYFCMKALALVPSDSIAWYDFSWDKLRSNTNAEASDTEAIELTQVEAWYTPQIPVSHGPLEYSGLPGLILEVSANNTTMLCYKIVLSADDQTKIKKPGKGEIVKKSEYQNIVMSKMAEMRDMYRGRR